MSAGAARHPRATAAAGLALTFAFLAGAVSLLFFRPVPPEPARADPSVFSARRAFADIERLAAEPRPVGSAAHERAREYLVGRLRELGLEPRVQRTTQVFARGASAVAARIENVTARVAGTRQGAPALLLMAHYDSRPHTFGAADDAHGVAVILEVLRAMQSRPRPTHDVIVLFADGEELALLGARAFVDRHPWAEDVAVVLNLDARGRGGTPLMFETRPGNLPLVQRFGKAKYPVGSSLADAVYRRMPNDTDFSPFRDAGVAGLNFAFLGGLQAYHTALDTAEELDLGSVQQVGEVVLSLVEDLEAADLAAVAGFAATTPDAVFFSIGRRAVVYPASWSVPLALGVLALLVPFVAKGWRDALVRPRGLVAGAIAFVALLIAVPVSVQTGWWALQAVRPDLGLAPYGFPYPAWPAAIGLLGIGTAVGLAVLGAISRWADPLEIAAGIAATWSIAALALAIAIPGASYLLLWPLAGLVLALGGVVLLPHDRADPGHAILVVTLGAVPAVLLLPFVARLLLEALTFAAAGVAALPLVLFLSSLAVPAAVLGSRWRIPVLLAVLAAGGAWLATDFAPSARQPRTESLSYALDASEGLATWFSTDERLAARSRAVLGAVPTTGELPDVLGGGKARTAPAPPVALEAPAVVVRRAPASGGRASVRVVPRRPAAAVRLTLPPSANARIVSIGGRDVEDPSADLRRVTFYDPGPEGLEVEIAVDGSAPVEIAVADLAWGLSGLPDVPPGPLPPEVVPDPGWWSEAVIVTRRAEL